MANDTKIEIDFFGGLHGHFLEYCINAMIDSRNRVISPFTKYGTSHAIISNKFYHKHAYSDHYTVYSKPLKTSNVISIVANNNDCLLPSLLCLGRSGDYNFDLKNFEKNLYDQIKNTKFSGIINHLNESYGIDISATNSVRRGLLREYFKFSFHDCKNNFVLNEVKKQQYSIDTKVYNLNYRDLYDYKKLIIHLTKINQFFNLGITDIYLDYTIWQTFIDKNKYLAMEKLSHSILTAIIEKRNLKIDFNLIQESWLNAQLENLYRKEMPLNQEKYFSNTQEIIEYLEL